MISFEKSSSYTSATYEAKIIFIFFFVFCYLIRFGRLWSSYRVALLLLVVLPTLIYSSVESSCRALLPAGISSYLVLACSVVSFCGVLWYLVRGIVLYRLVGSYIVSCIVYRGLSYLLACLVVPVACGCLIVPRVATAWHPEGTVRRSDWQPSEGGGDFSKRGEGQTETRPVPIFMRKVEKNVIFKRKTGENQGESG